MNSKLFSVLFLFIVRLLFVLLCGKGFLVHGSSNIFSIILNFMKNTKMLSRDSVRLE